MRSSAGMLLLAGFIMAFTALPTSAVAQEQPLASAEALLDAAARQSAGIASLNAEFVQEKSMAVLARPMTSQGYFCLRRGVQASSVQDGKEVRWKNLKQVWRLLRDENAFDDYIRTETDAFLKGDEAGSVKR